LITERHKARIMTELAGFTGGALRMVLADDRLKKALDEQEILTREMSHRLKNLFSIIESMITMSARTSTTKEDLVESLSGRVHAPAVANGLVRRTFSSFPLEKKVDIREAIAAVLRPFRRLQTTSQKSNRPNSSRPYLRR
jgi:two-component sensor histidine kinase